MKLGDSIDFRVATLGVGYESYLRDKQEGSSGKGPTHGYSQEQLAQMMETVRNERKNNTE